jgi:hypothetical protein
LAGIFIALAVLARPVALLLPFWVIIGLIILNYLSILRLNKTYLKNGLIGLLIFTSCLLPWIGYVYVKYNRLIPVASNLSYVFGKANKTLEYLDKPAQTTQNSWKDIGKAKIKNIYLFWDPGANGYNFDMLIAAHPSMKLLIYAYKIFYFLILGAALYSLYWLRGNKGVVILSVMIVYFWSVHTVLFPFPRYTLPVIPLVIILAIYSIYLTKQIWPQKY